MKELKLSRGQITVVDDADYEWLAAYSWYACLTCPPDTFYAARCTWDGMKRGKVFMHRMITDAPPGLDVDHKDGNKLNNTRSNLRICTRALNLANRHKTRATSGFRGVYWDKARGRWSIVSCGEDGRKKTIRFDNLEEAARERDAIALAKYGEFAVLNFPLNGENAA